MTPGEQNTALDCARSILLVLLLSALEDERRGVDCLDQGKVAKLLRLVLELQEDLWDLEPCLVDAPPVHADRVDILGLFRSLEDLASLRAVDEWRIIDCLMSSIPDAVKEAVLDEGADLDKLSVVRDWWCFRRIPDRSLDGLDREIDSSRRWRRIHAAKRLRSMGHPDLIDHVHEREDIDPQACAHWRDERRHPAD